MSISALMEQKPLTQIFNESAAAAYEAFPEVLYNLAVIEPYSNQLLYVAPEIADRLSKNVNSVKDIFQERRDYFDNNNCSGAVKNTPLAESTIKLLALRDNRPKEFSPGYTLEMEITKTFDHEIGHLIVKNGLDDNDHLAECAADAYAALRHIQRYGKNTDLFKAENRAASIVYGTSPVHYTDAVFQKVKQISEEKDISTLSLRETAELAAKIASEYHLPEKRLEKIWHAFAAVEKLYEGLPPGEISPADKDRLLGKCFNIMKENKDDHDIYGTGRRLLSRPDNKSFILGQIKQGDPFWEDDLLWMAKHEKESGIILDAAKAMDAQRPLLNRLSNFVKRM